MNDWRNAIEQTYVVKFPQQHLATFGITRVEYFIVTEPLYLEFDSNKKIESVVRTGLVKSAQPVIITPTYAMNNLGFSESAHEYMKDVSTKYGPNSPGIVYEYTNEHKNLEIIGGHPSDIANNIRKDLDNKKNNLSVVIVGIDEFWDVALLKFIYEYTAASLAFNSNEMKNAGLMDIRQDLGGLPVAATNQIEEMFKSVYKGGSPEVLKHELDKWGVYRFYEDRFLDLFKNSSLS